MQSKGTIITNRAGDMIAIVCMMICDGCGYELAGDMTNNYDGTYSVPDPEWSGWKMIDGKLYCEDCLDEEDPREEAFTLSERNPSLTRR